MDWLSVVAVIIFLIGIGAGGFIVARSPSFWIAFATQLSKKLLPLVWKFIAKRMPPEEEAAWRDAYARGKGDEFMKERNLKKLKPLFGRKKESK